MTATATATLAPRGPQRNTRLTLEEAATYLGRIQAVGWTQNEAARRVGKDPGFFSRWIRGHEASAVIRKRLEQKLARAEARAATA